MAAPKGNKYAVGANGGKPPLFKSANDLIKAIDGYFQYIQGEYRTIRGKKQYTRDPEPATVTGLALYLGFASRQSLFDYEQKEEYSYIIKRARTYVEHEYEKALSGDKPTGAIFALKNMNWRDKIETEHSGSIDMPVPEIKVYNSAPPLAGSEDEVQE